MRAETKKMVREARELCRSVEQGSWELGQMFRRIRSNWMEESKCRPGERGVLTRWRGFCQEAFGKSGAWVDRMIKMAETFSQAEVHRMGAEKADLLSRRWTRLAPPRRAYVRAQAFDSHTTVDILRKILTKEAPSERKTPNRRRIGVETVRERGIAFQDLRDRAKFIRELWDDELLGIAEEEMAKFSRLVTATFASALESQTERRAAGGAH
jgi:hypothetical protein